MKRLAKGGLLLAITVAMLVACAPAATPETIVKRETVIVEVTAAPEPTAVPPAATPIPYPETEGVEMVDTTKWKKDPPWTIAYANASASNSFRIFSVAALMYEGQNFPGLIEETLFTNANDSNPKQIADVEDLLVKGVDCIILAPTSSTALCPAVEKANDAGVPVVVFERGMDCDPDYAVTYIDVGPYEISRQSMEWLCEQLDYEGKVVVIGPVPGVAVSALHEEACRTVADKYPGIEILAHDFSMVSRSNAKNLMEAWLRAYPQIDGVQSWESVSMLGAVEAAQEAGRFDEIKAWAGKGDQGGLNAIYDGLNAWAYFGYSDGTIDSLHACIKALRGEPVPHMWYLPVVPITSENVDDYVIVGAPDNWWASRLPSDQVQALLDEAATK
jgi:ribose transport system substrate-binding protein